MATGTAIINRALVEIATEGTLILEDGRTLTQHLEDALNDTIDDIVVQWPFSFLVGEPPDPVPTVAGTSVYSAPSGSLEVVAVILDTGATDTRKLTKIPLRRFRREWAAIDFLAQGKPRVFTTLNEAKFQVAPRPDAVHTMRVTSTKDPATITDFALEVTAIPNRFHEVLVFGVAGRGALKKQNDGQAVTKFAVYNRGVRKMIEEDQRDPDIEYEMQPFRASGKAFAVDYWKTPFVLRVD